MNGLREILAETNGDVLIRGVYGIMFFLLALCSLVALVNHVRLELEARKGYRHRALIVRAFFEAYDKRMKGLEEADGESKGVGDTAEENV